MVYGAYRITTDNGPQFKSTEFSDFCKKWGIHHEPLSQYHHIANGYKEASIKSVNWQYKLLAGNAGVSQHDS